MKKVGIIGGMGPESTRFFYRKLIRLFQKETGAVYHDDYPFIIIVSLPIPDNVTDLEGKKIMKERIVKWAKALEELGVDFAVMPCNTEHIFYTDIIDNISIPMLNIIEETIKKIKRTNCKKVLLLSTETTIKYGLYDKDDSTFTIIKPNHEEQQHINKTIYNLLGGKILKSDYNKIINIIKNKEIDGILIGCTELSILFNHQKTLNNIEIFDGTEILAQATFMEAQK